ncbi:hypothetical protein EV122DRAFT_285199 [Schizophyllum commune]
MSAPAELLSHDSPSPLLCSRRTFLATKFTPDKCYSSRAANSLDDSGHCRLTEDAEDMNLSEPIPRGSTSRCRTAALDASLARSHLLSRLARRIPGVVVGPIGPWWVGGDESLARSGAERRCAGLSARASHREILANRRQMRRDPRLAFSLIAATVERGMGAARSAAEGADTEPFSALFRGPKNAKSVANAPRVFGARGAERRRHSSAHLTRNFANRRQLRRGPRGNPSLTAATCTLDHIREVEGLRDQQRGALLPSGNRDFLTPSKTEKSANRRQMDRGPRLKSSLMFATDEGGEGGGAKRRLHRRIADVALCPASDSMRCPPRASPQWNRNAASRASEQSRLYLLPSSLDPRCAIQELILDLQRFLKGLSGSEATYRRPASEGKSFTSSATLTLLSATLFEPLAPLATPSILVSTSLNISQALGAEIT